jgi:hypothetical protein
MSHAATTVFPNAVVAASTPVVRQHRRGGHLLFVAQFAVKGDVERLTFIAPVADDRPNPKVVQRAKNLVPTSSRQPNVLRVIFSARDDPGLVPRGQSHRLGLVELGILEGRQPKEPIAKPRV